MTRGDDGALTGLWIQEPWIDFFPYPALSLRTREKRSLTSLLTLDVRTRWREEWREEWRINGRLIGRSKRGGGAAAQEVL